MPEIGIVLAFTVVIALAFDYINGFHDTANAIATVVSTRVMTPLQAILMALTILLIHTYFGYFATGGPSGVGVAVGDAVRTSLIVVVSVTLLVSLAIYGSNGNFNLSG